MHWPFLEGFLQAASLVLSATQDIEDCGQTGKDDPKTVNEVDSISIYTFLALVKDRAVLNCSSKNIRDCTLILSTFAASILLHIQS